MSKQDGAYARTAADLERKYNFGRTFAEVYGLVSDAQKAAEEAQMAIEGLDHEEIFNRLTNYGDWQGIYRDSKGDVYINASYIKAGTLSGDRIATGAITADKIEANAITTAKIDTGAITTLKIATGAITATQIASSTITGDKIAAGAIDANHISAGAITANHLAAGAITASQISSGVFTGSYLSLDGLLTVLSSSAVRGYIGGGMGGANGKVTYGVKLSDSTDNYGVIATTAGAKLYSPAYELSVHASGITAYGSIKPGAANSYDLGSSNLRWGVIYAASSDITTSDKEKKNSIVYGLERYEELYQRLRPVSYKFNDGTSGRTHVGFISQDVETALAESELTSLDFAGFIKSPKADEDGNTIANEYDYALRYEEFIALNTHMIQKLMARVSALEEKLV